MNVPYELWKISEWEVNATASYKAIHHGEDNTDYAFGLSDSELTHILYTYGISTDGKTPLSLEQIQKKSTEWKQRVYNNFKATRNLGSITNIKGSDLEITDKDKYQYWVAYTYPCQSLSIAGKQHGMKKGSGTRSALLWEVERILNECEELPQVLIMENVPQVHGTNFIYDFTLWLRFLESKGYHNFWKDLNAKDYGVAQNRDRCFCVSFLDDVVFNFPKPIPLEKTIKDYLEDTVDEKYYIKSERAKKLIDKLIVEGTIPTNERTNERTNGY